MTAIRRAMPGPPASDRRFVVMLPIDADPQEEPRRIWEVEPAAVFVAVGVLVERCELEGLFLDVRGVDRSAHREDSLLLEAVRECGRPGPFAEAVERLLDVRTSRLRSRFGASPMSELAAWWLGVKDRTGGLELTALLWSLARDPRWTVRPLLDMVRGHLWVRALRLLGT